MERINKVVHPSAEIYWTGNDIISQYSAVLKSREKYVKYFVFLLLTRNSESRVLQKQYLGMVIIIISPLVAKKIYNAT